MRLSTLKRIAVTFCVNHILAGPVFFDVKRRLLCTIGYEIGENTKVVGPIYCSGFLRIGKDCWIGKNLHVNGNGIVEIGDCCDIAPEVLFQTGGHKIGTALRRAGKGETYSLRIGNGVWIGGRATLTGNITVGSGSVVASCACVVKDVPENTLVGGVPARPIREM